MQARKVAAVISVLIGWNEETDRVEIIFSYPGTTRMDTNRPGENKYLTNQCLDVIGLTLISSLNSRSSRDSREVVFTHRPALPSPCAAEHLR
jgi:hypothetical protein